MKEEKKRELNEEQKKAAFCTENAVIAAGAGSGKTMVLASRYAWLITEKGYKVNEILTLTFTKKAANQMFRRIHSLLTSIANNEKGKNAQRAQKALDDFIHARIQTLDSYCAALVKQCAFRYGISPEFMIDQDRSREIAAEEALPFLIGHRHHPAIEGLYPENGPNDIARNIFSAFLNNICLINKQIDFNADIKRQFNIICEEWQNNFIKLNNIIQELESHTPDDYKKYPGIDIINKKFNKKNIMQIEKSEIHNYLEQLLNEPVQSVIEKAESHPLHALLAEILHYISDLNDIPLEQGKSNNPVKNNLKQLRELYPVFSSIIVYCMQAGLFLSIYPLFNELQNRFLARKRAEGILTFADIASLSRTILLEQKDIRASEKEAFKAIMIDEFQDNNELQKDLLFLLAEKMSCCGDGIPTIENMESDKLFFVGDEKQSVYLFRGADVSVFRKLKDDIKSANLPLKINYRSVSGLIGTFNALFGGSKFDPVGESPFNEYTSVFAPKSGVPLPLYEAEYSPLAAKKEAEGKLTLCILNGHDEEESSSSDVSDDAASDASEDEERLPAIENEAHFVAKKIEQLLNEKTPEGEQKYKPKDIAILFRTHKPQHTFEKHLRLLGIPYSSENINDLFFGGVVNDIMSVLRLAAHPLDRAAYAEMLRSPFAGLSISGTAVCLSATSEENISFPFNNEILSFLDEDDQKKYLHGQKIYTSICKKAESESISSLISELWYKEGYRYETQISPNISVYREYYDYLFLLAVKADNENMGLAAFTEYIINLRDSDERLQDIIIPLDRPGAVNLLTIHKSKGLEFPVVFICCCAKNSRSNQVKKIFFSQDAGVILSPPLPSACYNAKEAKKNFFWEQIKTEENRKRTAELRRLLYVAMTRAEEKLFITGVLNFADESKIEDFSLKIKNHTNTKFKKYIKENKIYIEGDSIINNDTFFGLVLPAISSHIPPEGHRNESSFFNIESIPVYTEEYLKKQIKNAKIDELSDFISKKENFYDRAQIIKTPIIYDNHLTPASLKHNENDGVKADFGIKESKFVINKEFSGIKSNDVFDIVDAIILRLSKNNEESFEKFNFASFGTIAHICAEALLNKQEAIIPSKISGGLKPSDLTSLLDAGKKLAKRFIDSPLGLIAQNAKLRENEFTFRTILKNKDGQEIFINGSIDLFFDDNDCIHIVDFKTDSKEVPEEHAAQMSCYYRAVSDLFGSLKKPVRVWLYYLRSGNAIEIIKEE